MMGNISVQTRHQSEKPKNRGVFCFYDFKISKTYVMIKKKKKKYSYMTLIYPTLVNDMSFMSLVDEN